MCSRRPRRSRPISIRSLIATLPTNRDLNASVLQAPAVHATGPSGAYSISGSNSFESLFMVNGVAITENLRGTPYNLYIEDAIQETTVSVGGVSAEYGRFSGGVVNLVTKSGGNIFSGSFRDTYNNDKWRTLTPFETDGHRRRSGPQGTAHRQDRSGLRVHASAARSPKIGCGSSRPAGCRTRRRAARSTPPIFRTPTTTRRSDTRARARYTLASNHRVQANFLKIRGNRSELHVQHKRLDGRAQPRRSQRSRRASTRWRTAAC